MGAIFVFPVENDLWYILRLNGKKLNRKLTWISTWLKFAKVRKLGVINVITPYYRKQINDFLNNVLFYIMFL